MLAGLKKGLLERFETESDTQQGTKAILGSRNEITLTLSNTK